MALLVYSAKAGQVSDLMVDGEFIMKNYKILTLEEDLIRAKVHQIKEEIFYIVRKNLSPAIDK